MARTRPPKTAHDKESLATPVRLGTIVQQLRKLRHESLQETAARAGISPIHLSRIERLESSPTEDVIRGLAKAFDVPVSVLFGERASTAGEKRAMTAEEQHTLLTEIRALLLPIRHAFVRQGARSSWIKVLPPAALQGSKRTAERHRSRMKVVGIGTFGATVMNTLIAAGSPGIDCIAVDTDVGELRRSLAHTKVAFGTPLKEGRPREERVAEKPLMEDLTETLRRHLEGAEVVFLVAGLGGSTGTEAAPVIAHLAKQLKALTIGVVTTPLVVEGREPMAQAQKALQKLQAHVDTLLTLPQQRAFAVSGPNEPLLKAFEEVDRVTVEALRAITEIMNGRGLISVDVTDIRKLFAGGGLGTIGSGSASGEGRAAKAALGAMTHPLLEPALFKKAKRLLVLISGDPTLTLQEVNEAAALIQADVDDEARIVVGSVIDEAMKEEMWVTVIAAGASEEQMEGQRPSRAQEAVLRPICLDEDV